MKPETAGVGAALKMAFGFFRRPLTSIRSLLWQLDMEEAAAAQFIADQTRAAVLDEITGNRHGF